MRGNTMVPAIYYQDIQELKKLPAGSDIAAGIVRVRTVGDDFQPSPVPSEFTICRHKILEKLHEDETYFYNRDYMVRGWFVTGDQLLDITNGDGCMACAEDGETCAWSTEMR